MLKPIGPGMQTLEPEGSHSTGTLNRATTPSFPTSPGAYLLGFVVTFPVLTDQCTCAVLDSFLSPCKTCPPTRCFSCMFMHKFSTSLPCATAQLELFKSTESVMNCTPAFLSSAGTSSCKIYVSIHSDAYIYTQHSLDCQYRLLIAIMCVQIYWRLNFCVSWLFICHVWA